MTLFCPRQERTQTLPLAISRILGAQAELAGRVDADDAVAGTLLRPAA
jgi:hypothetical protein